MQANLHKKKIKNTAIADHEMLKAAHSSAKKRDDKTGKPGNVGDIFGQLPQHCIQLLFLS
jgi:hypothetical protein